MISPGYHKTEEFKNFFISLRKRDSYFTRLEKIERRRICDKLELCVKRLDSVDFIFNSGHPLNNFKKLEEETFIRILDIQEIVRKCVLYNQKILFDYLCKNYLPDYLFSRNPVSVVYYDKEIDFHHSALDDILT